MAWSVVIMLATRLLCDKIYSLLVVRRGQSSPLQKRRAPTLVRFPETPMPPTPLIRVLETIDLSRVDVESLMAEIDEAEAPGTEQEEPAEESKESVEEGT
jgi:hypothetical protein